MVLRVVESPIAIYQLHIELIALLDSIFEMWLGFTFATLVAMHFAAVKLGRFMLIAALGLYLIASIIFASRYLHTGEVFTEMNAKLIGSGFDPYPTPDMPQTQLVLLLFVLGTVTTMYYSIRRYIENDQNTT